MFSVPVRNDEGAPELMLILGTPQSPVVEATQQLTRITAAMRLWLSASSARDANWQVQSLASIIAMVTKIESQPTVNLAAEETVNLMANQLPVTRRRGRFGRWIEIGTARHRWNQQTGRRLADQPLLAKRDG